MSMQNMILSVIRRVLLTGSPEAKDAVISEYYDSIELVSPETRKLVEEELNKHGYSREQKEGKL